MDLKALSIGNRRHELAATVALIRTKAHRLPVNRLATLIDHAGSAVGLVQLRLEDVLFSMPDADWRLAGSVTEGELGEALQRVDGWLGRGLDVRTVLDPNYPRNLHSVFDRPPLVFVEGHWLEPADSNSIAIVGTRSASLGGLNRARRLAAELVESGYTILSGPGGGRRHRSTRERTALERADRGGNGYWIGSSVPCGEQTALRVDREDKGGTGHPNSFRTKSPRKWMFPSRNVVMSGLSLATVVVEAGRTSGARMQARVALQQGRTVFLLRSQVESHEWARKYVEEGAYGAVATEVTTTAGHRFEAWRANRQ